MTHCQNHVVLIQRQSLKRYQNNKCVCRGKNVKKKSDKVDKSVSFLLY